MIAALALLALSFASPTRVVLLGTGNPNPVPERSGPCVAILAGGSAYLVDCGPGVVRRAAQAARDLKIPELAPNLLTKLFITHLHTDHTVGLPDLMFTGWIAGRSLPLDIYGPPGTSRMTRLLRQAYSEDVHLRVDGMEQEAMPVFRPKDIKPGVVYQDANVKVVAFPVQHGEWKSSYGYRFVTKDKVIVISGDTTKSQTLIDNARGCDILVHEVYGTAALAKRTARWKKYHSHYHTASVDLAALCREVKPKLLVLYHQLPFGGTLEDIVREVKAGYDGPVADGRDFDVFGGP